MYKGTLIAVKNMDESKKFYHDILGINVVADFGANVQLDNGLFCRQLIRGQDLLRIKIFALKITQANFISRKLILMSFLQN